MADDSGQPVRRIVPANGIPPSHMAAASSVFNWAGSLPRATAEEDTPADSAPEPAHVEVTPTKVGLALAYVEKYGSATRKELASVMGLESDGHLKSFLKTPLADGRLACDGENFQIGPGRSPTLPRRARKAAGPTNQDRPAERPGAAPIATQAPAETIPTTAHINVAGINVRIRADGSMAIAANGGTVTLSAAQAQVMRTFDALLPKDSQ